MIEILFTAPTKVPLTPPFKSLNKRIIKLSYKNITLFLIFKLETSFHKIKKIKFETSD